MKLLPLLAAFMAVLAIPSLQTQAADSGETAQIVIPAGSQKSVGVNQDNFTGAVRLEAAFNQVEPARAYGAYVTFEPGARTNWHIHPLGQTLIVTAGKGITQEKGKPATIIRPGDVVVCPPGVQHWHGAAPDTAMTHLAIGEKGDPGVTWLQKVDDAEYARAAEEKR